METLEVSGKDHKLVRLGGRMDLRPCSFHVSGTGTEVYGTDGIEAAYNTKTGFSSGRMQLAADRFNIKGKDVTRLNAELVYDPNTRAWSADNFLGDCYGGHLLGRLRIEPVAAGVVQYLATVGLVRVDLKRFLLGGKLDPAAETSASSGTMNATLGLGASIGDGSSRLGVCRIDVADMQVGKVSPLANLLAVLSLTEPTDFAFERMLLESYLKRNKLLISKFDMSGKNLAFTGSGTATCTGADVLATAYGEAWKEALWVVVDHVGAGELCWVTRHGISPYAYYYPHPDAVRVIERTADARPDLGLMGKAVLTVDELAILRDRDLRAVALMGYDRASGLIPHWWQVSDTIHAVVPETLERAAHACWTTARVMDESDTWPFET